MLTSTARALNVTRANAALLDSFLEACARPEVLDHVTRAALDIVKEQNDDDFAYGLIRLQIGQLVSEIAARRSTRSMVSVGSEYAIVFFMLGASARKLAPGVIRQADLPSWELMNALMILNMTPAVKSEVEHLMSHIRSAHIAHLAMLN